ncbi:MAG: SEC-C metal-binding domain-containing protein [Acidimicrobiia bacterium]
MERARIQFLFGDDVDPHDLDVRSDLLAGEWDEDYGDDRLERLRIGAGEIVIAQVAGDNPPEVWATAERLLGLGLDRHQVFLELRVALLEAIGAAARDGTTDVYSGDRYRELLAALPLSTVTEVANAVIAVVAEHQGLPGDEVGRFVVEHLRLAAGLDDDSPRGELTAILVERRAAMTATLVDLVITELTDGGPLEYLPPDRLIHVERLTAGIVLTHRLTDGEVDLGVLTAGFDLAGFARRHELRLPGGAEIDVFSLEDGHPVWQGPAGWLDAYGAGALLAIRVGDDDALEISELAVEPAHDPALVARLRAVYDTELAEAGVPVFVEHLLLGLLAGDGNSFAKPRPPLTALCEAAELERRSGHVAHDDSVWQAGFEHAVTERILDRLEGDEARTALRILHEAADDHPDPAALRETLAGLAQPGVADAVLDELIPGPGVDDDADPTLIDAVRDAASAWAERLLGTATSRAEMALARWVAAVVAERRGEVLVADAHLILAIEADPDFEPALDRAAWYASDRGDAARALRLWRRLEVADPADLDTVAPFTRPIGREPGRNEPCWCGSGRKFKTCHLGQPPAAPLPDRVVWLCRKAVGYLKHSGGGPTADVVACAVARALDPDDPESIAESLDDPIVLDAALTEGGWFERFVADRGSLLPDDEALLATSWTMCDRTVYEIEEVSPGTGLSVVDLRTGDRLDVRERTFSRQARTGTLVCARAVPDGETHQFVGAVFPVAPGRENELLELCDYGDPEELCRWVRALRLPPTLVTRENEPVVACQAVLTVDDPAVAGKVLDQWYDVEGAGWVEMFEVAPGEDILRAMFELDGDRLTVTTHSEARLDRVLGVLRDELRGAVVVSENRRPLRTGEMPEAPPVLSRRGGAPDGALLDQLDQSAVVVQIQDEMERRWLDEPVPALGGLTPREAAADPTRREQLERLLDSYPDIDPTPASPGFGLRPQRLRTLLGLPRR